MALTLEARCWTASEIISEIRINEERYSVFATSNERGKRKKDRATDKDKAKEMNEPNRGN